MPVHYGSKSHATRPPPHNSVERQLTSALTPRNLPPHAVVRTRLLDRLDGGRDGALTLLRAPAGTGKSVALRQWLLSGRAPEPVVWVGLERDADCDWMLTLIGEGLVRRHVVGRQLLRTRRLRPRSALVAELGAALAAAPHRTVLVLDCDADLPHGGSADLHDLLSTAGGGLRLITATRAEPLLPLHVYRLNDDLVEIGARDLAFSPDEARELVAGVRAGLPEDVVDAMTVRTQGWAAGLLMMAGALADTSNPGAELRRLGGASGDIADYLAAEVLDRLPRPTRELLMRGSVVDFLRPGLTEELVGQNAARSLAILSHDNVFVEALSAAGWYRYHPLLRELLRTRLTATLPREAARLQYLSTHWLVEHHLVEEAIRNAVAVDSWDLAARTLIDEYAVGELLNHDGAGPIGQVFAPLPPSAGSTAALIVRAVLALNQHEMRTCATLLRSSEERLARMTPRWPAAALTLSLLRTLHAAESGHSTRALITAVRRLRTQLEGDAKAGAHRELALIVEDAVADALFRAGSFAEAARVCTDAVADAVTGYEAQQVSCMARLAFMAAWSGHCRRAMKLAEETRTVARGAGLSSAFDVVRELALALACTDTGELRDALRHSAAAATLSADAPASAPGADLTGVIDAIVRSRVRRAAGDRPIAAEAGEAAVPVATGSPAWLSDQLIVEEALADLLAGRPRRPPPRPEDLAAPARELGRLVSRHAALTAATIGAGFDGPDLAGSDGEGTTRIRGSLATVVHAALLEAMRRGRSGDSEGAGAAVERALKLAAPEGLRRPFLEAPEALRAVLPARPEWLTRFGWVFDDGRPETVGVPRLRTSRGSPRPSVASAFELTDDELEVLTVVAQLVTTDEAAALLGVPVDTVRAHVRGIVHKLGVRRRSEAVRRARELGILPAAHLPFGGADPGTAADTRVSEPADADSVP